MRNWSRSWPCSGRRTRRSPAGPRGSRAAVRTRRRRTSGSSAVRRRWRTPPPRRRRWRARVSPAERSLRLRHRRGGDRAVVDNAVAGEQRRIGLAGGDGDELAGIAGVGPRAGRAAGGRRAPGEGPDGAAWAVAGVGVGGGAGVGRAAAGNGGRGTVV